ncbi:HD domain-containing protein [Actinomadura oligospora]|uniref:HD domain-containing protein n=1 Tax=Actinomadura oligospora TaxID=111804 RepID=UPI00047E2883|nr:HD domain-containing protein [Actinomadura oligospora]
MADETERLTDFLFEVGLMKRYKRTGWLVAGVSNPESIADHSHRAAVIASVLAAMEGADPERAALLSLFHDTQETRLTDLPYLAKPHVTTASNEDVTEQQTHGLPDTVTRLITGVVAEYEGKESVEALCARDADKLECLIQAVEYRDQGNRIVHPWIESSLAQLRTESARRVAHQAIETGSGEWFIRALKGDDSES